MTATLIPLAAAPRPTLVVDAAGHRLVDIDGRRHYRWRGRWWQALPDGTCDRLVTITETVAVLDECAGRWGL